MDDSAFYKAVLFNQLLHNSILRMSIHPDIPGNAFAVFCGALKQAVNLTVARNPVDCKLRLVVQPIPVFNTSIGRFPAFKQREHPVYPAFIVYDPANVLTNI